MNPIQSISSVFRNYINFSGRAQRSEYWWFTLFSFVSQAALNFVPFIGWIYGLVLLLPSLAVTVRRLHDTGRSAGWLLIYVGIILAWIVVGIIAVIVLVSQFSDPRQRAEEAFERAEQSDLSREEREELIEEAQEHLRRAELLEEAEAYEELARVTGLSQEEREELRQAASELRSEAGRNFPVAIIIIFVIAGLVSAAGVISLLILCALPGTRGPNRYGPDPLQPDSGVGGYGYQYPGHPYAPPPLGGAEAEAPPEPSGRLYCSQCGAERQAEARFCTACGANF